MDLINKISLSRKTLQKFLEKEWDTSTLVDYSSHEIEKIYGDKKYEGKFSFGKASSLNFTLNHKLVPSHKLHVIYYNFPELNSPPLKINIQCGEKMEKLYLSDDLIDPEDSILLIIYDSITENLEKTIEDVYKKSQEYLNYTSLSSQITEENEKLGKNKLRLVHFRNIHIFNINTLTYDITKHSIIPKHECIRDNTEIETILKKTNSTRDQLPEIQRTDAMAKMLRMAPGDICHITRKSERCGEYSYYRICV